MGNHYVYSTTDRTRANVAKGIQSVCSTIRKCKNCNRLLRPHEIETRHVCGTAECPSCKQYRDLHKHQCYIQNPEKLEEKRKLFKSRKRKADGTHTTREEKDHVFVYWDSETMQDTGVHVPNLVCAATSNSNVLFKFEGSTCIRDLLDWLLTVGEESKLTVLAHNSQGFDSYLILNELYKQYIVPDQIVNGAKILSLSICWGRDRVQGHALLFPDAPLSLSQSLWTDRTKERFLSPLPDLYPTKSTTTPKACRSNAPKNSTNGTTLMSLTTSLISKPNFSPTANRTSYCSKVPVKCSAKNSKTLVDSTH